MLLFNLFQQLLTNAVNDPHFIASNTIMQDGVTQAAMLARIAGMTQTYGFQYTDLDVQSVTSGVILDSADHQVIVPPGLPASPSTQIIYNPFPVGTPPLQLNYWCALGTSFTVGPPPVPYAPIDLTQVLVQYRMNITDTWRTLSQASWLQYPGATMMMRPSPTLGAGAQVAVTVGQLANQMALNLLVLLANEM